MTGTALDPPVSVHRMWGGRFHSEPDSAFHELNRSLPVDWRLWRIDVRQSQAWTRALHRAGFLSVQEATAIVEGLDRVEAALSEGVPGAPDEDVHSLVERMLYDEIGPPAGRLNMGRSRNDQVATDLRLWTMGALEAVQTSVRQLGRALVEQAEAGIDIIMPGYTHGQRAQPVRWSYVLAAHAHPLSQDLELIAHAADHTSVMPLGSGALAGSTFNVDLEELRRELGFKRISTNGLHATGDRDFVAEALFALTMVATHVARLASELFTWASSEYGFIHLSEQFCSGSSLMPQKRNPDALELARAKAVRVGGDLSSLIGILRTLPAGYCKDLQEDKHFLFDAVDNVMLVLPAVTGTVSTMEPCPEVMEARLDESTLATDLAELLAGEGMPFRQAHSIVGQALGSADRLGLSLRKLPPPVLNGISPALEGVLDKLGSFEHSVEGRRSAGGPARNSVKTQLSFLRAAFD